MMQTNLQLDLAFNYLENTGTNIFLTGKAGTGKTTFLKKLKETSPKRMIVVAPTGVAAINAGGVTIHSFFQLPFGPYIPGSEMASGQNKSYSHKFSRDKINIIRSMDLLVIDEVSMVRADLLDAISDMLRRYRDRNKPFGGVQLLLIGDLQQLAPVAKEDEWNLLREHYASPFFFDSKALSESDYLCIELTQVYRQADDTFVRLLNNIRENRFDENTLHTLNQRYIPNFKPNDKAGYITLTTHNYQAQQINNRKLQELPGPAYTYKAEIKDDFPAYSYPTDEVLELKQDAQVMFVKNDSSGERRYYNGKIGRIVFISPSKIIVSDELGNDITVDRETWTNVKYTIDENTKDITETIAGSFSQYPLKTAWAITIHKSQGLTFEHAIIDASAAFSHGQVYVALSRCKTLEGMVLSSPITRNAMISDEKILSYTSSLSERQPCEGRAGAYQEAGEKDSPRQDKRTGRKENRQAPEGRPRRPGGGDRQLPHQVLQVLHARAGGRHRGLHHPGQRCLHPPDGLPELSQAAPGHGRGRALDRRQLGRQHDGPLYHDAAHPRQGALRPHHGHRHGAQRPERQGPLPYRQRHRLGPCPDHRHSGGQKQRRTQIYHGPP